jgi:hypothetical protein
MRLRNLNDNKPVLTLQFLSLKVSETLQCLALSQFKYNGKSSCSDQMDLDFLITQIWIYKRHNYEVEREERQLRRF